ncbi:MAG: hypothetical protein AAGI63_17270 [Planctomycetota bacterium]
MNQTAYKVEKRILRRGNGLESLVDMVALAVVLNGSLVAFCVLLWFASLWGLFASIQVLVSSCFSWLLLRCLAEHLRLLKKISGQDFEGEITGSREQVVWGCSLCGHTLYSDEYCDACNAQIVAKEN